MRKNRIAGVTLISLLIGLGLGAFLILIMLQIFAATRNNYRLTQNLAEMNNVLRYAQITMTDIVTQAGYRTPDPSTGALPAYTSVFTPFAGTITGPSGTYDPMATPNSDDPAGVVISTFDGQNVYISEVDPNYEDKFWVKFQGDPNGKIRSCNDLYGDGNEAIKIRFYSREADSAALGEQTAYYCERHNDGENYAYDDDPVGTVLIPGNMFDSTWVRYGEDLTGGGFIDRWALGSDVQDRNRVYAVRIAFLIHSKDDVRAEEVTQIFDIFGEVVQRTSKKIYKLQMFTILLPHAPNYSLASQVGDP